MDSDEDRGSTPLASKNLPSLGKNFFFALNKIKLHNE